MTDTVRLNDVIKKSGLRRRRIATEVGLLIYGFWRKTNNGTSLKQGRLGN